MILHIDIETYSEQDISRGVRKYASCSSFEIQLISYYIGKYSENLSLSDISTIDLVLERPDTTQFIDMLKDPTYTKVAHNAAFEIACLEKHFGLTLDVTQWGCSMVKALSCSFPGKLEKLSEILDLKNKKGKQADMLFFSKPFRGTKREALDHIPRWMDYIKYNKLDVLVEMELEARIPFDYEKELWHLHMQINRNGVRVDVPFVKSLMDISTAKTTQAADSAKAKYGLNVRSCKDIKALMQENGFDLQSYDRKNLKAILELSPPDDLRDFIEKRLVVSEAASNSKLKKMLECELDGKIYDTMFFYGCSTGRWAGRGIQVHNFPRTSISDKDVENIKNMVAMGIDPELMYSYTKVKACLRSTIIPDPGKTLQVCDFSGIEARVLAWLAKEQWLLDAFAKGEDIYVRQAMMMYGLPYEEAKAIRAKGKVATLSLGYNGGANALLGQGFDGTEEEATACVNLYRRANKNIVLLWKNVQESFKRATACRPTRLGYLTFTRSGDFVLVGLPSGRSLKYYKPEVVQGRISYMRVNPFTRKWERSSSFGGKIVENITQAVARDVLVESLKAVSQEGSIVFHVHDEIIAQDIELPKLKEIMSRTPAWAKGLPLSAEGYSGKFYKKG
jgi:DNA polymerase